MADLRAEALGFLCALRDGTEKYDAVIFFVRNKVQEGGLSLESIGTSEEELEQLRLKCCKTTALQWLNMLRGSTNFFLFNLLSLRGEVEKGGFSLEDIDTNEQELACLAPR